MNLLAVPERQIPQNYICAGINGHCLYSNTHHHYHTTISKRLGNCNNTVSTKFNSTDYRSKVFTSLRLGLVGKSAKPKKQIDVNIKKKIWKA